MASPSSPGSSVLSFYDGMDRTHQTAFLVSVIAGAIAFLALLYLLFAKRT